MKKNIIYMAALAIMAAACSSEDETTVTSPEHSGKGEVKMITETIRATNGDGATRAAIADDANNAAFSWSDGDKIAVHVSDGKYYTTDPLNEGGAEADFTVTYTDGYSRDAFAVYPATIVAANAANYGQENTALDVTLPASYTLAEVSGTTTPCPMIATNKPGNGWNFQQLCGLLRLTVSNIPSTAKRLEISFNGKKVCGDFSIDSPVTPGTSVIASDGASNDVISITKDGTDVALGSTELVLNIPLPVGNYTNIDVTAYDALNEGNKLLMGTLLSYQATRAKGVKRATALGNFKITFKDKDSNNVIEGLRFVRIFSSNNKLHNGPYTISSNKNMPNPIFANLVFDSDSEDEFVFQVIDKNGKVYSGSMDQPAEGYVSDKIYKVEASVKAYTFTVASGEDKKVYFSPGDLGVNNGVYSFTEPFTNWAGYPTSTLTTMPSQRSWFDYTEIDQAADPATQLYGITWRIETKQGSAYEWDYIFQNRTMNSDVSRYYKVTVGGHANCLLLPPDEAVSGDIGTDLTSGTVTDYLKYLAKGFVLLMDAKRGNYNGTKKKITWYSSYSYWVVYDNGKNRKYLEWSDSKNPEVFYASGNQHRMHVRLIHDAN